MRIALLFPIAIALGCGGAVGLASHSGVLAGLADRDVDLTSAALVVGTSAGAVAAGALRAGRRPEEIISFPSLWPPPTRSR